MNVIALATGQYQITGRSLARQLRNATAAERDRILCDLRGGKLIVTDLTKKQLEHLVAVSLVWSHRPPDPKRQAARLARLADKAVERCGNDAIWDALDRRTTPVREAAE